MADSEHRTADLSIREHIELAESHAQRALRLAYGDERQTLWVRLTLGRAQSILMWLVTSGRLR